MNSTNHRAIIQKTLMGGLDEDFSQANATRLQNPVHIPGATPTIPGSVQESQVLSEADLYIEKMAGKVMVIKCSGNTLSSEHLTQSFAREIVCLQYLGIMPVVVHGGGKQITKALKALGITPTFIRGLRVTDQETMNVVKEVLLNVVARQLGDAINLQAQAFGNTFGKPNHQPNDKPLSQNSTNQSIPPDYDVAATGEVIIHASQLDPELGFVGKVDFVDAKKILCKLEEGQIPVISSIGISSATTDPEQVAHYNINADTAAAEIAIALGAERLHMLTDVDGVYDGDQGFNKGSHISELNAAQAEQMIISGAVTGGMIPKLKACLKALGGGVSIAHILNGEKPYELIFELFTDSGTGTMITGERL